MSEEQINIAIAEACGWTEVTENRKYHQCPTGFPPNSEGNLAYIPDYCRDLNAMHKAERMLNDAAKWSAFRVYLNEICGEDEAIHATALQRAEAFLRTIKKWEEAK